jgi:hypothetical protein
MIWRERRMLLIVLGLLLAANTIYFFTYRVRYQSRLDDREQELSQKEAQLEQAHAARLKAERTYQSYRQIQRDVQQVFDEHWSTQTERFTQLIAEVKRLATASSLTPAAYGFNRDKAADPEAMRQRKASIGASEVGIGFGVKGTYEQVRRLINLLELSRQFVIIDQIGLSTAEGDTLSLNLHLKTLFRDEKSAASKRL